jgi:myo-inositol 2-dehydrogenase/D-chiro-inositol 1-dehydrogenase
MWYLERHGDPVSIVALGNRRRPETGMEDNFTALLRFRGGAYAVVTETLAAFEYHHVTEVVGREGAIRAWWSGTLDRTRQPAFELKVKRRGGEPETVTLAASGELFELEAQLAQAVVAFRERRPLVSGEEARKRVIVCVEAERSLRDGREIPLSF